MFELLKYNISPAEEPNALYSSRQKPVVVRLFIPLKYLAPEFTE
jgi:hypothetical protein